jgi:hypothetical protein
LDFKEVFGFKRFIVDFVKGGNAVIPFEQRSGVAAEFDRVGIHRPNRIEYRMIMGVQDVFLELGVAGNVNLSNAIVRDVVQVIVGIETVVLGRDVDVIYIKQDSAVG